MEYCRELTNLAPFTSAESHSDFSLFFFVPVSQNLYEGWNISENKKILKSWHSRESDKIYGENLVFRISQKILGHKSWGFGVRCDRISSSWALNNKAYQITFAGFYRTFINI